jgi:hypothetical protein
MLQMLYYIYIIPNYKGKVLTKKHVYYCIYLHKKINKNTEIRHKHKYQLIQVTVPFNELNEIRIRFIQVLMLNLKINYLNTILFQYSDYSTFTI